MSIGSLARFTRPVSLVGRERTFVMEVAKVRKEKNVVFMVGDY